MSATDRDVTGIVRSWLHEDEHENADRVLDLVLDQLDTTPQRRPGWLARRFPPMNTTVRIALATAAVVIAALLGVRFLGNPINIGTPSQTATPTPKPLPAEGQLEPGTYRATPFAAAGAPGVCEGQPGCTESPADNSIAFTVTVPDGWSISGLGGIWVDSNAPPDGAMLIFWRGGWLYEDPCNASGSPSMEVGPTADDFATAIADHPLFDATAPVAVTLGGYSGKYVDISAPADLGQCVGEYRLWDPGIYAQGPEHRWHLWILDVEGTRVVVQTMDYPGTPADRRADLQAMVDSLEITP
jgi:hypothetical protein